MGARNYEYPVSSRVEKKELVLKFLKKVGVAPVKEIRIATEIDSSNLSNIMKHLKDDQFVVSIYSGGKSRYKNGAKCVYKITPLGLMNVGKIGDRQPRTYYEEPKTIIQKMALGFINSLKKRTKTIY